MDHHLNRNAGLGAWVLISARWYHINFGREKPWSPSRLDISGVFSKWFFCENHRC